MVEAALSRFALELVSQPWADEMLAGVHALGDCPLDAALARVDRVSAAEAPELAEKLSRVSAAHQEVVGTVCLSAVRALACEGLPNVAIAFAGTPAEAVERLCNAAVPQRSGVVLVGAGPYPGAQWRLALSAGREGRLEGHVGGEPVSLRLELGQELGEPSLLARAFAPVTAPLDAGTVQPGPVEVEVAGGPVPGQGGTAVGPESAASEASAASQVPEDEHGPAGSVVDGSGPGYLAPGQDVVVLMDEARAAGGGEASHEPGSGTLPSGRSLGVADQERRAGLLAERGDAEIRLLGPVDVVGGEMGALEASRRMAALAVLAYVASHDHPVSAEELASSLWPLDARKDNLGGPQRKTVMNVISRARALLGYGAGGRERLVHSPLGYKLTSDVTCDWARFGRMVSMARSQRPTEAAATLRGALELVRGEPFGGALSSQFFEWASSEHLDLAMSARVVDAAEALGEMALAAEDLGTVTWAVDKGLQLDPAREELFRLWMHALGRGGRPAKVDEVYRRLRVVLQRRIHPLQEPQPESREVWRMYTVAEVAGV
jgi:DNA-binding SARP family transcriptional activator